MAYIRPIQNLKCSKCRKRRATAEVVSIDGTAVGDIYCDECASGVLANARIKEHKAAVEGMRLCKIALADSLMTYSEKEAEAIISEHQAPQQLKEEVRRRAAVGTALFFGFDLSGIPEDRIVDEVRRLHEVWWAKWNIRG